MQAHQTEATVGEGGVITLHGIPFSSGETVEITISAATPRDDRMPLRGTPVTLIDPTTPVADSDWEAAE